MNTSNSSIDKYYVTKKNSIPYSDASESTTKMN